MKVGKRLFPYPVLSNEPILSSYNSNCKFELRGSSSKKDGQLVLENIYGYVESKFLNKLIDDGKAEMILVVESPDALYRKILPLDREPKNREIPFSDINLKYSVSAFIVATEDIIINGSNNEFVAEYNDVKIAVERHDILAFDQGYSEILDYNDSEDLTKSSIFSISGDPVLAPGEVLYKSTSDEIEIHVDTNTFTIYNKYKNDPDLQQKYMSLLVIPALVYCIQQLIIEPQAKDISEDVDSIIAGTENRWFISFCNAFKKKYNRDFKKEDLLQINHLVQDLFHFMIGNSVATLHKTKNKGGEAQ